MRILLLDEEKITKLTLPLEVDGIFVMHYKPIEANVIKELSIEAHENKWLLRSNDSVAILIDGKIEQEIYLEEYLHINILLVGRDEVLDLYCLPTLDNNLRKVLVSSNQLLIGSSNESAIMFNIANQNMIYAGICLKDGSNQWFLAYPQSGKTVPIYLNNNVVKDSTNLYPGDIIFINGLKIVWMQEFMNIYAPTDYVSINQLYLQNYIDDGYDNTKYDLVTEEQKGIQLYHAEDYFYHRPSLKEYVKEEEIAIDQPPPTQMSEDDNFLATFGASFTMMASSFVSIINLINNINNGGNFVGILTSGIMCVSMLIGSILIPKLASKLQKDKQIKKEKLRVLRYSTYLNECDERIKLIMAKQAQVLKEININVSECINLLNGSSSTLWNREIKDEDFLIIRLGIGNVPAQIKISAPEEHFVLEEDALMEKVYEVVNSSRILENVPVTFNFLKNRVAAIIDNVSYGKSFLESLIVQLTTLHSAQDLKMVFFINDDDKYDWEFTKYLPHVFNEDKSIRYYASTYDEMKILSSHLENLYNERSTIHTTNNKEGNEIVEDSSTYRNFDTYYVLFTNDVIMAKSLPIFDMLLNAEENFGFSIVYINKNMNKLPKRCNTFIALSDTNGCVMEKDINSQIVFAPEYINGINLRALSSKLMNIPIASSDVKSSLPNSISFLETYNVSRIEQLNITNRWKTNDPTISLGVPIGVHTSGEQFILDLHEKAHGPHGLIAGSTGSGKSEFIMTFILSLAVNFHPDEVQFVLIDYKGGGLAGAFENREKGIAIPHLAGTITNLDSAAMNRSLVSINSELKRREQMFMDARDATGESTLDIYKYQKYYREGIVKEPMSHLFIISDEFAELKAQQPEFMNELISTARVGRSLGVHLILATQKPSGVVNDQIWANAKFKVCLKVQTTSDSQEMLKKPDAASLKEAGRFYLQVGYDEYFDIGQSGWAGAKYVPADRTIKKVDDSINFINNIGSTIKSIDNFLKKEVVEDKGDQLTNIVKMICEWSKRENYLPRKLWLDPLPEKLYLGNLAKKYNYVAKPYVINPIIGEFDNPKKQKQGLLTLDLNKGNTFIYGKNGSGKEDLISTIIYSTCINHSPKEINFYIVDMGAGTLRSYLKYPQVGDVCTVDDGDKIIDLMAMVEREINRRKDLTVDFGGNFESYNEMNPNDKLPLMCVIINNLDIFVENLTKVSELIIPLYRDGAKYGVVFILSCINTNVLRAKTREYFVNHLSLVAANKDDYFSLFSNYPRNLEPASFKGRGLIEIGKEVLEFQSAMIYTKNEVNNIIKSTAMTLNNTYKDMALQKIPSLPKIVNVENFLDEIKTLDKIPIGYNIETKSEYYYDFKSHKVNLISANDFDNHLGFLNALVMELKMLDKANYDIKIIDFSSYFDILTIGLTCYQSNFNDTFGKIIEESQNLEKETIYIFTGIGKLKAEVATDNMPFVNKFFIDTLKNSKIHFIFIETYEQLNLLKLEDWYNKIVKAEYGIWLGPDVGSQTVITFTNLSSEDRMINNPEYCFVAENGKRKVIKQVVYKKDNDEGDEL